MTREWRNRAIGLALAAAIYVLDQWLKGYVSGPLGLTHERDHLDLLPFFDLTRTHNLGVSLGMFPATSPEMRWGLIGLTGLIATVAREGLREYYDPWTGKGMGARDFAWSALIAELADPRP